MVKSNVQLPRSDGSIPHRREQNSWPNDQPFRILSIDGGGIRGVFSAGVLAKLERDHCNIPIADHFDIIVGTSTGGIIALGLGAGRSAEEIRDLYLKHGGEIFPPFGASWWDRIYRFWNTRIRGLFRYRYDRKNLEGLLDELLGEQTFGSSKYRHLIPAIDGRYGEVAVFKNRFHTDYKRDHLMKMSDVALATSAAPTIFQAHDANGFRFIDGGIWANNPTMLGVLEALISFDLQPSQIRVLSIGCGDDPFNVSDVDGGKTWLGGGIWSWKGVIGSAMRCQSLAATNQARLLVGPHNVVRIDPNLSGPPVELDDYNGACDRLLPTVSEAVTKLSSAQISMFFEHPARVFTPAP